MKSPQPDLYNLRVIHLARRFVLLPFTIAAAVCRWLGGCVQGLRSDKAVREKDQLRQSRARRELRGLPPDHDASRTSRP